MRHIIRLIKKTYRMVSPQDSKTVLKNAVSLTTLQAITYFLPILILPYLFRVIGVAKFGLISFAQAFVQYFMILTDYGFSISATKQISLCRTEDEKVSAVFSSVMVVKLALAFLSFLAMSLIVFFIPKFRNDWMVYVFSFGAVIGNTLFPVWFFQGTEKMRHIAEINIIGGAVLLFSIFFFVKTPEDYLMVPLIYSSVFLITGVLGLYVVFRRFGVKFKFPGYANLRQQLKAGWDIFISIVAINAYTTTRIFTVGLLTNNTLTGFYSIAEKIANFIQTFPLLSVSQAVFPRLSKIYHHNKLKAFEIMQHIQRITINISLITLPLIFILSDWIVLIICGGDYPQTVLSLRILIVSVFFIAANAFRVQFLLVCGKTHIYSRIHVIMALVGLPLIFLLTSTLSYPGTAIATIIIEAGIFSITYASLKNPNLYQN